VRYISVPEGVRVDAQGDSDVDRTSMKRRAGALGLALVVLATLVAASPTISAGVGASRKLIVMSAGGSEAAAAAVERAGGSVTRDLPLVGGVSAVVPSHLVAGLRAIPGLALAPDSEIGFQAAPDPTQKTPWIQRIVRSAALWKKGITGKGITVALLDTGVHASSPDLQGGQGSRVIHCEDFSAERNTAAHCRDTFGHGTFMAGLIAGNGDASSGRHVGAAPKAKLVSVKVAGFDGSTDVSHVLAGIQWVVAHEDIYGIRVLNLSLGSDSSQDYRLSPLNLAVERAWRAGIAVVVSAGNSGDDPKTVMKPGDDPYVITVGASNDEGTLTISDDRVPVFSSRGPTRSNGFPKPDIVSPGVHTISLRSPGSAIDQQFGATARVGQHYFRGTGTSMSTATVSGIVAQMLQHKPGLSPNEVKWRLTKTARPIVTTEAAAAGAGLVDAEAAATTSTNGAANKDLNPATGLGGLQADRGSLVVDVQVQTPLGPAMLTLTGEYVAQTDPANPASLVPWVGVTYAATGWDPATWDLTTWATKDWAPTAWEGTQWRATVWDGTQWRGTQWRNVDWDGTQWRYSQWDGTQWRATTWQSKWYAAAWD
jgi:serine protease AprX